jgi:hypothetical protein
LQKLRQEEVLFSAIDHVVNMLIRVDVNVDPNKDLLQLAVESLKRAL